MLLRSIRSRLLGLVLATVVPFLALIGAGLWSQWRSDQAAALQRAIDEARLIAGQVDDHIGNLENLLTGISRGGVDGPCRCDRERRPAAADQGRAAEVREQHPAVFTRRHQHWKILGGLSGSRSPTAIFPAGPGRSAAGDRRDSRAQSRTNGSLRLPGPSKIDAGRLQAVVAWAPGSSGFRTRSGFKDCRPAAS